VSIEKIKAVKIAGVTALVLLLLFAALGPAKWQYRTGLGWRMDHVVGYFGFTLMFCLAWPRPIMVGAALMLGAMLLEALQALTPDRCCDFEAALYGVGGALTGALFFRPFSLTILHLKERTRLIPRWLGALLPARNEGPGASVPVPGQLLVNYALGPVHRYHRNESLD
jgi:VanZ family protein